MQIPKTEIANYIPQREPFIMIDNLVNASAERFETDFKIVDGNIFLDNGKFREFGLVENIAQSSAAGLSVTTTHSGKKLTDGFIGAISKLKVYKLPEVNQTIQTIVTVIARLENLYLLKGENFYNGDKLLECEIKLAAN